jgi:hypothetical protein
MFRCLVVFLWLLWELGYDISRSYISLKWNKASSWILRQFCSSLTSSKVIVILMANSRIVEQKHHFSVNDLYPCDVAPNMFFLLLILTEVCGEGGFPCYCP